MPKARDHGQGALYWVESRGMWKASIDVGFDPDTGRRLQRGLYSKTKEGAVKKLNAMLRERDTLGRVMDRSTRVAELADRWLSEVATRTKPSTVNNYRSNVRSKIVPAIGKRMLTELTPTDVRHVHALARSRGSGDAGVAGTHRTLVTMLEFARSERLIAENVAKLTPPKRSKQPTARNSLTRDEAQKLLALEDPRWTLGLLTGLRSGEARGLRWQDVDLHTGVATLAWSLSAASFTHGCGGGCGRKHGGACPQRQIEIADDVEWHSLQDRHVLVRPKNDTARQVPLTTAAIEQLRRLRAEDTSPNPHGLVWRREDGSPRTNTDDNHSLRAALIRAGINQPQATTHWLRHSYVTLSEHAGVPWTAFSGVSGHGTTEASDPYRHVLTSEGKRAVDQLSAWLDATLD